MKKLKCWKKMSGPRTINYRNKKTLEDVGIFKAIDKQGVEIGFIAPYHNKWVVETGTLPFKMFKKKPKALSFAQKYMKEHDTC